MTSPRTALRSAMLRVENLELKLHRTTEELRVCKDHLNRGAMAVEKLLAEQQHLRVMAAGYKQAIAIYLRRWYPNYVLSTSGDSTLLELAKIVHHVRDPPKPAYEEEVTR